jgi:hypothetical protein
MRPYNSTIDLTNTITMVVEFDESRPPPKGLAALHIFVPRPLLNGYSRFI